MSLEKSRKKAGAGGGRGRLEIYRVFCSALGFSGRVEIMIGSRLRMRAKPLNEASDR
jgi:hypothetical protein